MQERDLLLYDDFLEPHICSTVLSEDFLYWYHPKVWTDIYLHSLHRVLGCW